MLNALRTEEPNKLISFVGFDPDFVPASFWAELVGAMTKATEQLFGYFEVWETHKQEIARRGSPKE